MVQLSKTKESLDKFVFARKHAKEVSSSKLVVDATSVQELDKQLASFLEQLKSDAAEHEHGLLKEHAKAFEKELHNEVNIVFERTKQDLLLYQRVLKALSTYREDLKEILNDPTLTHLAQSELNYADLLIKTADEKLATLSLLFKKLKK